MIPGIRRAGRAPLRSSLILVSLVFAALAFRLVRLTDRYAVNIFFSDQWDINDATLFQYHSLWEIFRWQHGPHRQGLGGLLAIFIEPWFHWNSRSEAFLATGLVVIAALCALYLKYRLFGCLSWTDVVIPIIILSPAQWDSLWNVVNLSHGTLPLLLVILYCLVWTWRNERVKFALITVLNFVILYTGFGLFIGFLTPVLLITSYRAGHHKTATARIYLLFCTIASVVSMASFFVGYRSDPASGCASLFSPAPVQYFWFMDLMYVHPFGVRGIGLIARFTGAIARLGCGCRRVQLETGSGRLRRTSCPEPCAGGLEHLLDALLRCRSFGQNLHRLVRSAHFAVFKLHATWHIQPVFVRTGVQAAAGCEGSINHPADFAAPFAGSQSP